MAKLLIEIRRGGDWDKLTTVRIDSTGPRDDERARDRAQFDAARMLAGWRSYFGPGEKLRITEQAGW